MKRNTPSVKYQPLVSTASYATEDEVTDETKQTEEQQEAEEETKLDACESLRDAAANGSSAPKQKKEDNEEKLPLFVDGKIKMISDVDVVGEQFTLRFHVHVGVPITEEKKKAIEDCEDDAAKSHKVPMLTVVNLESEESRTFEDKKITPVNKRYDVSQLDVREQSYDTKKYPYVFRAKYDYNVTCFEEMELRSFPFDCQDLCIDLRCEDEKYFFTETHFVPKPKKEEKEKKEKKEKHISLPPEKEEANAWFSMDVNNLCLKDFDIDFSQGGLLCELYREPKKSKDNKSGRPYSHFLIRVKLKRSIGFYFWNFFLINGLLSLSSLTCFAFDIDPDGMGNRYGTLFTLLLTIMASKFVISDQVPKLSYNTALDIYIIANFAFIMLLTFAQTPFSLITNEGVAEEYDHWLVLGTSALWLLGHIVFIIYAFRARRRECLKLNADSLQLDEELRVGKKPPLKLTTSPVELKNGKNYKAFRSFRSASDK